MIHPRRSLLFMPGSNARALEKARNLPADGIILDLEDSVAPEAKALARDQIAQAIAARGFGKREVSYRAVYLRVLRKLPKGTIMRKVRGVDDRFQLIDVKRAHVFAQLPLADIAVTYKVLESWEEIGP